MADLDDLYHDLILDHGRSPRHFHTLPGATHHAEGYNPLCGDRVRLEIRVGDSEVIADIAFTGAACAICLASASMMTDHVKGLSAAAARHEAENFRRMLVGGTSEEPSAVSRQPSAEGTEASRHQGTEASRDRGIEGSRRHGGDAIDTQHAAPSTQHSARSPQHAAPSTQHSAPTPPPFPDSPLAALAGVRKFPMRVKCATLPWHTLLAALDSAPAAPAAVPVSTE